MNRENKILSKNVNYINIIRRSGRSFGIFGVIVLLIIILSFLSPNFLKTENILNVIRQSSFLLW